MTENNRTFLPALLRSAAIWGAAFALMGGALVAAVSLFDPNPGIESLPERVGLAIMTGVMWGVRFGLAGLVVGAGFAAAVRVGYRGRKLAEMSPLRLALIGAVTGAVGVPLYLQLMNVVSGGATIPWGLVTDDAVWAGAFGAVVGGGSILLARRAERLPAAPETHALGSGEAHPGAGRVDDPTRTPEPQRRGDPGARG